MNVNRRMIPDSRSPSPKIKPGKSGYAEKETTSHPLRKKFITIAKPLSNKKKIGSCHRKIEGDVDAGARRRRRRLRRLWRFLLEPPRRPRWPDSLLQAEAAGIDFVRIGCDFRLC